MQFNDSMIKLCFASALPRPAGSYVTSIDSGYSNMLVVSNDLNYVWRVGEVQL
jgi:hypothetical protein